jgi:hypothetical protein
MEFLVDSKTSGCHSLPSWFNPSRTATGEISKMSLNGEHMVTMMKIAPDAVRAHTISVIITVGFYGANPTRCGHGPCRFCR